MVSTADRSLSVFTPTHSSAAGTAAGKAYASGPITVTAEFIIGYYQRRRSRQNLSLGVVSPPQKTTLLHEMMHHVITWCTRHIAAWGHAQQKAKGCRFSWQWQGHRLFDYFWLLLKETFTTMCFCRLPIANHRRHSWIMNNRYCKVTWSHWKNPVHNQMQLQFVVSRNDNDLSWPYGYTTAGIIFASWNPYCYTSLGLSTPAEL